MSVGPELPPDPTRRGPMGPSSVAGDLAAIFAEAAPGATVTAGSSRVRAVSRRRVRLPATTLGAVAAAGLVGLTAGSAFVGLHGKADATPPSKPAQAVLPVQVAAPAPTVTLSMASRGPIPVLDTKPVSPAPSIARTSGVRRAHALVARRPTDLMRADRQLRAAYSRAVQAGVPRHVLVAYRDRWADLRQDAAWRPARVAAGYGRMSADLERLARRSHGRAPPRRGLFWLFS